MRFVRTRAGSLILLADAITVAIFIYYIPALKRPFEHLMLVLAGLAIVTMLLNKHKMVQNIGVMVIALSLTIFTLEMVQKKFQIVGARRSSQPSPPLGIGGKYTWDAGEHHTYIETKKRAIADGVYDPAIMDQFAGDIFTGAERETLSVKRSDRTSKLVVIEGLKPLYTEAKPLGFELTPSNKAREYSIDGKTKEMLYDGAITVNEYGFRETKDNKNSDAVYVIFGCSQTFGFGLNDDQTWPHYFSAAGGFDKRVLNLAVSGYGVSHSLRDLETNLHMGRAGIEPKKVRAVVMAFIEDHANRAFRPTPILSPRYMLENGEAVYQGSFADSGRFILMLEKGRLYPALREAYLNKAGVTDGSFKKELTIAIVAKMNRICRERYGIPLTVFYLDDGGSFGDRMRAEGIEVIYAKDILGENWRQDAIHYMMFDSHSSPIFNKKVGEYLYYRLAEKKEIPEIK